MNAVRYGLAKICYRGGSYSKVFLIGVPKK